MRAGRLISLLLLLQSRQRMTAAELAAELEVSERTVYRDVLALSGAGIPVFSERGPAGGYRLLDGYRTRLTGLTREEAEALFLPGGPTPAAQLGLSDALTAAHLKVLAALPPALRDASQRVSARFHLDLPRWFDDTDPPPALSTLATAVWTDTRVLAGYTRDGRTVRRRIDAHGLVCKGGNWYLVGRVDGAFRTYRVDRFGTVEPTDDQFDRDTTLDLAAYWAEKSVDFERAMLAGTATVRLSPTGLRRLRHAVHRHAAAEAARTATAPDADGWVTVTLPIETIPIAHAELLRLGAEAQVLAPQELADGIAETAAALTRLYQESAQGRRSHS